MHVQCRNQEPADRHSLKLASVDLLNMHPDKVIREKVRRLTDLPNIGKAGAADLQLLGITEPEQLRSRDPWQMYHELCELTGQRHDPCVIDVFISITRFMQGGPAQVWWAYTDERQQILRDTAAK